MAMTYQALRRIFDPFGRVVIVETHQAFKVTISRSTMRLRQLQLKTQSLLRGHVWRSSVGNMCLRVIVLRARGSEAELIAQIRAETRLRTE